MAKRKGMATLLCAVVFALTFYGCAPSASTVIRMDIGGPVHNLDPQFATDPTAIMILSNIFEGLLVKGADGALRPGVAKEYQVSASGLVYTFTLREDARWQDGEPLTAGDFVFAFERIFSPQAPSPFAQDFLAIYGAAQVMSGDAPLSSLGVTARDPHTLVFTLERPLGNFLERLSWTAAMPCNRNAFQESRGRYGLAMRYVHSNGPFVLSRWDASRLHLDRNEYFREEAKALPERVMLYIGRQDPLRQFLDGRSDLVRIPSERLGDVSERQAQFVPVERTVWGLVFNQNASPWGNPLLRQSLALTLDKNLYAQRLPAHLSVADAFVPPAALLGGQSFRSLVGDSAPLSFAPNHGRRLFSRGLEVLGYERLPQTTLLLPESHYAILEPLQVGWIRELGVEIGIAPADPDQISERLSARSYDIMLMPFYLAAESPGSMLRAFYSGENRFGYHNPRFDYALRATGHAQSEELLVHFLQNAERILLEDAAIIPVYFETSYYAVVQGLVGVEIFPFCGRVLFQGAERVQ